MERPSLTLMLASVVAARLDGDPRPLLSHLHPLTPVQDPRRSSAGSSTTSTATSVTWPRLAPLASVSTLPRVIPMQRRHSEALAYTPEFDPQFDPDFDPTAA